MAIIGKASPMSSDFHDWLDQCPVAWFRSGEPRPGDTHVEYNFEIDDD